MRSLLLLLVSAIFIICGTPVQAQMSESDFDIPYEWTTPDAWATKIFLKKVYNWLDPKYTEIPSESDRDMSHYASKCLVHFQNQGMYYWGDDCLKTVPSEFLESYKALEKWNIQKIKNSDTLWWLANVVTDIPQYSRSQLIAVKKYQDGFLFISSTYRSALKLDEYFFWFMRINEQERYTQVFMTRLAPEPSVQFNTYQKLYRDNNNNVYDYLSFHKDLKKSFNKNRFNNRWTQGVYGTFLEFIDSSTPAKQ